MDAQLYRVKLQSLKHEFVAVTIKAHKNCVNAYRLLRKVPLPVD